MSFFLKNKNKGGEEPESMEIGLYFSTVPILEIKDCNALEIRLCAEGTDIPIKLEI
ncbi:hypothetical protein V8V91_22820 [Algoriphagus halophilus]